MPPPAPRVALMTARIAVQTKKTIRMYALKCPGAGKEEAPEAILVSISATRVRGGTEADVAADRRQPRRRHQPDHRERLRQSRTGPRPQLGVGQEPPAPALCTAVQNRWPRRGAQSVRTGRTTGASAQASVRHQGPRCTGPGPVRSGLFRPDSPNLLEQALDVVRCMAEEIDNRVEPCIG